MELYICHLCFGKQDEQIVSFSVIPGQPFEITYHPLRFERRPLANYLVGILRKAGEDFELYVHGDVQYSGTSHVSSVKLNVPFMLPGGKSDVAVLVTELMDTPLEKQIEPPIRVDGPHKRTEFVKATLTQYLEEVRTKTLRRGKAQLEKELAEVDGKLESKNAGEPSREQQPESSDDA